MVALTNWKTTLMRNPSMKTLAALAMMLYVTACAGPILSKDCLFAHPHRFSDGAVAAMDRAELEQEASYNALVVKECK